MSQSFGPGILTNEEDLDATPIYATYFYQSFKIRFGGLGSISIKHSAITRNGEVECFPKINELASFASFCNDKKKKMIMILINTPYQ
jgi:hypothetical protein